MPADGTPAGVFTPAWTALNLGQGSEGEAALEMPVPVNSQSVNSAAATVMAAPMRIWVRATGALSSRP